MKEVTLARRYARALVDLGREGARLLKIENDLVQLARTFQGNRELRIALENPAFSKPVREGLLQKLSQTLGWSSDLEKFLILLVREERIALLPRIAVAFSEWVDQALGRLRAEIVSAQPLDRSAEEKLRKALLEVFGRKEALLQIQVDPSLLAGFRAKVGGRFFEGSARGQLEQLKVVLSV
ncbi:MAG: ATP synthase F1 subunit delta [Deltaproteobacteria bacterium]|nr:ATP synthase F1 subunit delta [Deltaproteobacteria bacterium]